jgi:hypothetical protein
MGNKVGRYLARRKFVRRALEEKADLSAFRKPPSVGILFGIFLVCFSFLMSWPAIGALGGWAIYFRRPWIAVIGGPVLYGGSHVCFLTGMYFCGGVKYPYIFLRWAVRRGVEKLLGPEGERS